MNLDHSATVVCPLVCSSGSYQDKDGLRWLFCLLTSSTLSQKRTALTKQVQARWDASHSVARE